MLQMSRCASRALAAREVVDSEVCLEDPPLSHDAAPLVGSPPSEVPLPNAPLVRVIAQIRFSPILAIQEPEFMTSFQEAIRSDYPVLRQEHVQGLALSADGFAAGRKHSTWRFCDMEGAWRVSLAPDFAALETTSYASRSDFLQRLEVVLDSLEEHIEPALVQRLGLRYVDRVKGEAMADIGKLVRPEMLGLMATPLSGHMQHAISETILDVPASQDRVRIRWGRIPPQGTVDPTAIEPIDELSWILDLDMYSTEERPFSTESVLVSAHRYAERLYAVFRWAVTDEFLRRYGGRP